jgi:hypothetical protein
MLGGGRRLHRIGIPIRAAVSLASRWHGRRHGPRGGLKEADRQHRRQCTDYPSEVGVAAA